MKTGNHWRRPSFWLKIGGNDHWDSKWWSVMKFQQFLAQLINYLSKPEITEGDPRFGLELVELMIETQNDDLWWNFNISSHSSLIIHDIRFQRFSGSNKLNSSNWNVLDQIELFIKLYEIHPFPSNVVESLRVQY